MVAAAEPYQLHHHRVQSTCHINRELLHELEFSIFSAKVKDEDGKVYIFTLLPMEIVKIHTYALIPHHCHQTRIDKFFNLMPCGVDVKKVLQFPKTVNTQGCAMVDNDQGEPVPLHITSRVVADALHVSREGKDLTRWTDKQEKEFVFHMQAGREMTYADMRDPSMEPTLRLIS